MGIGARKEDLLVEGWLCRYVYWFLVMVCCFCFGNILIRSAFELWLRRDLSSICCWTLECV